MASNVGPEYLKLDEIDIFDFRGVPKNWIFA